MEKCREGEGKRILRYALSILDGAADAVGRCVRRDYFLERKDLLGALRDSSE